MNTAHSFHLFDVRGDYPQEVNERLAFIIGKSLLQIYQPKRVVVASDTRESSPILKNFLIDGLSQGTTKIIDLAEISMPQFSFSAITGKYDLGVMVTASHVSDPENGFKFYGPAGLPFNQQEVETLRNCVNRQINDPVVLPKQEAVRGDTTDSYINDLESKLPQTKFRSSIVIDITRSSVVTPVLVLFSRLGINFKLVKSTHSGNPILPANRKDIESMVKETKSNLGMMWDSDGDRVIFIDHKGDLIPMSFVLGMLAADVVRRHSGGKVAVDVRAGLVVKELVEEAGGELVVFPSWVQYLKFAMHDDPKIVFAGEISGHFIFKDFLSIDDGIYAGLRFLALSEMAGFKEDLQKLKKKYFELPELNIPCPEKMSSQILQQITEFYRNNPENQVHVVDGVTVLGRDFRLNIRESITEPFLRLNLETHNESRASIVVEQIENLSEKFKR